MCYPVSSKWQLSVMWSVEIIKLELGSRLWFRKPLAKEKVLLRSKMRCQLGRSERQGSKSQGNKQDGCQLQGIRKPKVKRVIR